jgi:Derlin-2/3
MLTLSPFARQIWRVATCFLFWGKLSLEFFFHIFFLYASVFPRSTVYGQSDADRVGSRFCSMRYSKMLEESAFHGRRADYVWLLIVSCTILLVSLSCTKS